MKNNILNLFLLSLLIFSCSKENGGQITDPLPTLSISDISQLEADDIVVIDVKVKLSGSNDKTVSVKYSTMDGTAKAGEDFIAVNNETLSFSASETEKFISIEIIGDNIAEGIESFSIQLSAPDNATISRATATVTISNDDTNVLSIPLTGYSTPETYPGMTLIWSDEFDNATIDTTFWTHEIGTGSNGWGNNELQYYRAENTSIIDGNLVIEANKDGFGGSAYTSSRIITKDKFDFKYGRVDIRAVTPKGQGIWPALWMLGANFDTTGWPGCGEIDIMELVGGSDTDNKVHGTIHWEDSGYASYGGDYSLSSGVFADKFHVFSITWDDQFIKWFIDDIQFHIVDTTPLGLSEFHENFFFIFNVAVGGNWPGNPDATTIFPQWMVVDYVRVFQ